MFQEKTCEEAASFDLTSFDIASCIEDVAQCIEFIECREHNDLNVEDGAGRWILTDKNRNSCVLVITNHLWKGNVA